LPGDATVRQSPRWQGLCAPKNTPADITIADIRQFSRGRTDREPRVIRAMTSAMSPGAAGKINRIRRPPGRIVARSQAS
jgi:hypothetical protein